MDMRLGVRNFVFGNTSSPTKYVATNADTTAVEVNVIAAPALTGPITSDRANCSLLGSEVASSPAVGGEWRLLRCSCAGVPPGSHQVAFNAANGGARQCASLWLTHCCFHMAVGSREGQGSCLGCRCRFLCPIQKLDLLVSSGLCAHNKRSPAQDSVKFTA